MLELLKQASDIAGRDIEVTETRDGMYVVLYMNFNIAPPPKGKTEIEALKNFIEYSQHRKIHGNNTRPVGESSPTDTSL